MEVFLRNLPPDLTERALTIQLEPLIQGLGIADFLCEKRGGATVGHITFLRDSDGVRFLARYGEELLPDQNQRPPRSTWTNGGGTRRPAQRADYPRTTARLELLGKAIYCKVSNRPADEITLRVLHSAAENRRAAKQQQDRTVAPRDRSSAAFELLSLSSGHNRFHGREMTFVSEWTLHQLGRAKFGRRSLVISLGRATRVQVRIAYSSIVEMVHDRTGSSLLVTLSVPPVILTSQPTVETLSALLSILGTGSSSLFGDAPTPSWYRAPAIDGAHRRSAPYCLVYHLQLSPAAFSTQMQKIMDKELIPITRDSVLLYPGPSLGSFDDGVLKLKEQLGRYGSQGLLPFEMLFSLQALVYNGYLHPSTVSALAERLSRMRLEVKTGGLDGQTISTDAVRKLFEWIDYPSPFCDPYQFTVPGLIDMLIDAQRDVRESSLLQSSLQLDGSSNSSWTFRAVVTPSRITLHGPEPTPKNRILRKFPQHQDYFMRVQFTDETGNDLFFNSRISLNRIYERFNDILQKGIKIAGRHYQFLGFSHSSLRAHSAWFCAPFVHDGRLHTHFTIISDLGNFSNIRSPARCAARIGQAFSETPFSLSLNEHGISVWKIDDIISRNDNGSVVFSDGIGTFSEAVLLAIWSILPWKKRRAKPTCYQIRYAGVKGMICYNPLLQGRGICFRPSMIKFESSDVHQLEICDMAAKPIPLVLNRQLIKILEDMGVRAEWFIRLQSKELNRLRAVTINALNTANFLEMQSVGSAIRLPRLIRQLEAMEIDYRRDRFLRSVVEAVVLKELRLLKHKSRIPVSGGITLFGVMDETGYLDEGEVYVACDEDDSLPHPIRRWAAPRTAGPVLVTRSPALHPGDVQRAINVAVPPKHPLTQLRNCIVFSQKGVRDLPSQLSGGDLDGDIYNVIWDSELRISDLTIFSPAKYPRVKPLVLDRDVTKDDMARFFVDFMKTDHLGVIATRHMILADQMPSGTLDEKCLRLAQLHSTAVDFSKSGIPVELRQLPWAHKYRPDFLAPGPQTHIHSKSEIDLDSSLQDADANDSDSDAVDGPRHGYYKSDKVLGRLYRAVDEKKIWFEEVKAPGVPFTRFGGDSFWDEFLDLVDRSCAEIGPVRWEGRVEEARRLRYVYEDALKTTTTTFSDDPSHSLTELEVFVGFIISKKGGGVQTQRQRDRSIKLRDEVERVSGWIWGEMRGKQTRERQEQVQEESSGEGDEEEEEFPEEQQDLSALELCLACVHIGCEAGERESWRRSGATGDLESFRIVAAAALVQELRDLGSAFETLL